MKTPRVLLVTDPAYPDAKVLAALEACARALPKGAFSVQLRDRTRSSSERLAWACKLRRVTSTLGVTLVVNGDAALARVVGADGVHFGGILNRANLAAAEGLWRSVAAHTDADVAEACAIGVDAALVSPIFDTPGKGPARGVAAIASASVIAGARLAVIALGGVDRDNAASCRKAGAEGVAVIRALLASEDPAEVSLSLHGR